MIMKDFSQLKQGDRLRCVDDKFDNELAVNYDNLPRKGMSYTVDKIFQGESLVTFKELPNQPGMWFLLDRFEFPTERKKQPRPGELF